jgi:sodium/hydrogen antiporter
MFDLSGYHVFLALMGAGIILAYWLPRFVSGREPAASALLIAFGFLAAWSTGNATTIDPVANPKPWEVVSELCVVIGLFGVGLRIDRLSARTLWIPTSRLLLIAMPVCIVLIAMAGWQIAGMTFAGALLLASVLAPTDPVLAGDVQVGPPLEGGEHPVRFALTTEAGLNDGLAFPFVYLALAIASAPSVSFDLVATWLARDVVYRIVVGGASGVLLGRLLGRMLFDWPSRNALANTNSAVTAVAGVLMVYGLTELVEGYGFIAAFVAGMTLRQSESKHEFHAKLHDFSQSIEHMLTSLLLLALGAATPVLFVHLNWQGIGIGLALILIIRPLSAYVALQGAMARSRERAVVAFYGVRGIGSIYYIGYACSHVDMIDEPQLWATVAFTIIASTVIHGFTAGIAVDHATGVKAVP